uniref:Uncharacterized protein n=1 Tax=Anguilla anguilla TaxID=7936 RepID=A0A0E9W1J2_ANGAN
MLRNPLYYNPSPRSHSEFHCHSQKTQTALSNCLKGKNPND